MRPLALYCVAIVAVARPALAAPPLPAPPAGWKTVGAPEAYDRSNVFEAIDGAAELFLAYELRSLRIQSYRKGETEVTVHVYDQARPLNAFGVFQRERPPAAKALQVGTRGAIVGDSQCMTFKAGHYVRAQTTRGRLSDADCRALLGAIVAGLPGDAAPPGELALLPSAGRVPGSEGYTRTSYLGTRDLRDAVHARYRGAGKATYSVFVLLTPAGKRPEDAFAALAARWTRSRHGALEVLSKTIPYQGALAVVRRGGHLLGVGGAGDLAEDCRFVSESAALARITSP